MQVEDLAPEAPLRLCRPEHCHQGPSKVNNSTVSNSSYTSFAFFYMFLLPSIQIVDRWNPFITSHGCLCLKCLGAVQKTHLSAGPRNRETLHAEPPLFLAHQQPERRLRRCATKHISTGCRCSVVQGKPFAHLCTGYRSSFCSLEKMEDSGSRLQYTSQAQAVAFMLILMRPATESPSRVWSLEVPTYPAAIQEKSTFAFTSFYIYSCFSFHRPCCSILAR